MIVGVGVGGVFQQGEPNVTSDIARDGLVLWLDGSDFENDPPTTIWEDKSNIGNDAEVVGFDYTLQSGSDGLGGVVFDNVDDYADVGNPENLKITGEITLISMVKYTENNPNVNYIVSKYSTSNSNRGYGIAITGGKVRFLISKEGSDLNIVDSITHDDGEYHYVVCTFKPSESMKIYVDGVLESSLTAGVPSSIFDTTANCYVGKAGHTTSTLATIKQTLIYNRVLTQEEITHNYNLMR